MGDSRVTAADSRLHRHKQLVRNAARLHTRRDAAVWNRAKLQNWVEARAASQKRKEKRKETKEKTSAGFEGRKIWINWFFFFNLSSKQRVFFFVCLFFAVCLQNNKMRQNQTTLKEKTSDTKVVSDLLQRLSPCGLSVAREGFFPGWNLPGLCINPLLHMFKHSWLFSALCFFKS